MVTRTISSTMLRRSTARARKAATDGPVFITTRGRVTHVLLTIEQYTRLPELRPLSLLAALREKGTPPDIVFEPAPLDRISKAAELD